MVLGRFRERYVTPGWDEPAGLRNASACDEAEALYPLLEKRWAGAESPWQGRSRIVLSIGELRVEIRGKQTWETACGFRRDLQSHPSVFTYSRGARRGRGRAATSDGVGIDERGGVAVVVPEPRALLVHEGRWTGLASSDNSFLPLFPPPTTNALDDDKRHFILSSRHVRHELHLHSPRRQSLTSPLHDALSDVEPVFAHRLTPN